MVREATSKGRSSSYRTRLAPSRNLAPSLTITGALAVVGETAEQSHPFERVVGPAPSRCAGDAGQVGRVPGEVDLVVVQRALDDDLGGTRLVAPVHAADDHDVLVAEEGTVAGCGSRGIHDRGLCRASR